MFADIATDQKLATFLRLHEAAFAAMSGVPHDIFYDWGKAAGLCAHRITQPPTRSNALRAISLLSSCQEEASVVGPPLRC